MSNTILPEKTFSARITLFFCLLLAIPGLAYADSTMPYPGTQTVPSKYSFNQLLPRLEHAIDANKMGLVAQASASSGAAARGIKIPGNAVLMVFRNDYAVRMLKASVASGIEAPLRLYVTENKNGTASVTYRTPSAIFAPYGNSQLNALAHELDPILAKIVNDAAVK